MYTSRVMNSAYQLLEDDLLFAEACRKPPYLRNPPSCRVSKNPEHHGRMKHLDRAFYWLRDQVTHSVLMPKYLPTEDNAADMLTKALVKPKVEKF